MDRLFLDANVLFSAAYRVDAGLVQLWKLKNVTLRSSHAAWRVPPLLKLEIRRVRQMVAHPGKLITLITVERIFLGHTKSIHSPRFPDRSQSLHWNLHSLLFCQPLCLLVPSVHVPDYSHSG